MRLGLFRWTLCSELFRPSLRWGLLFLVLMVACQPTNTKVSRRFNSNGDGSSSTTTPTDLLQLRITDLSNAKLSGTQTDLAVGDTLELKASLFDLNEAFDSDVAVRWNIKSISGSITSGLSCGSSDSTTCDFTPIAPGTIYIEAVLLTRGAKVIASTDTTHPIVVTAPNTATTMSIAGGNAQSGLVGSTLPQPLRVLVTDAFGRPVPGLEVSFAVNAGSASITSTPPFLTDANGHASVDVQLGTIVESTSLTATVVSVPSLTQSFSVSAQPGAPSSLAFTTPPANTFANLPLAQAPSLVIKDTYGNVVNTSSAPISVSVSTGNGSLSGSTTKNFIAGAVTFNDLVYSLAESNVILQFSSGAITLNSASLTFSSPSGAPSITPNDVDFGDVVTQSAGVAGRSSSTVVTLAGLGTSISIAAAGNGNPKLRVNGGTEQTNFASVNNGDTVQVVADAPSVHGTSNLITITLGGRTETFEVKYVDPNSVAYVFVSSAAYSPPNANSSNCTALANAAGYDGSWMALKATDTVSLKQLMPYQWGRLKRLDGVTVTSSWNQLWSATPLNNPINIDENLSLKNVNVFTGVGNALTGTTSPANKTCLNWSSSGLGNFGQAGTSSSTDGTWINGNFNYECTYTKNIYCVSNPTGLLDSTPVAVSFAPAVTFNASERLNSASATVQGVTTLITASISGVSGNPRFKVNGGAEVTSAQVSNGDQIQLVMTGPSVVGQSQTASLTLGTLTVDWKINLADSSKTAAVFVSSTSSWGSLGGVSGANATCQTLATNAGYNGTWKAILSTAAVTAQNNIPWNWGQLRRLDGALVANSWNDLWDGTIGNPINITENLTVSNKSIWTGLSTNNYNCTNFTSSSNGVFGFYGDSSSTTATWASSNPAFNACGSLNALYCISDPSGTADTDPNPVSIPLQVVYNSGETVDFPDVTILGITNPINVTLSGAQGSPILKINGIIDADNMATVTMGDKVQIRMTAPTVLGNQYAATLTLGPDIYSIKIGYADSTKTARVFVSSAVFSKTIGVNGLDSACTAAAESGGLGGTWKAMVSTDSVDVVNRIPWNWGTLKLVDNTTTVAMSWSDLWDGSIANPINMDELLNSNLSYAVGTGSTANGFRVIGSTCSDWTQINGEKAGLSSATSSAWFSNSIGGTATEHFYCLEDPSAPADTTPTPFKLPYKVFQEPSTLITSTPYLVKGLTTSVSFNLTDLSPGGIAGTQYSINNSGTWLAAGVSSTVNNGDSVQIRMTSPAALNSSYKAQFTVGTSGAIPWRVWTKGVASGTTIKRIFVSAGVLPAILGGVAGADSLCQTQAATQGLTGTWKALISGEAIDENNWAINRLGYQWTELWTMNSSGVAAARVLSAPNLWNNNTLESLPNVSVSGTTIASSTLVATNTDGYGFGMYSGTLMCNAWTANGMGTFAGQSSGSLSGSLWLSSGDQVSCGSTHRLYCVEQ